MARARAGKPGCNRLAPGREPTIDTLSRPLRAVLLALGALLLAAPGAAAATRIVDSGTAECPNAAYSSIQDAVDEAAAGDTIVVCPGLYQEGGTGLVANALVIDEQVTIAGAGADRVRIEPATDLSGQADPLKTIRDESGNVVLVRAPAGVVNISGVTVAAGDQDEPRGMKYAEAGVVFHNASGALRNSRVTDLVPTSTVDFSTGVGVGVVAFADGGSGARDLDLEGTLVEGHAKGGVLIDAWDGATQHGDVTDSVIRGRGRGATDDPGQGQNGIQVSGPGASATVLRNAITGHFHEPDESSSAAVLLYALTTAGIQATNIEDNDFRDNGYGVFNADVDGCDAIDSVSAPSNWWGHLAGPSPTPTPPCPGAYTITGPRLAGDRVNGVAVDFAVPRTAPRGGPVAPAPQTDTAPSITAMSPADGAVLAPDSVVPVAAIVTDDFDVAKVEFLRGATVVATDTTRPYAATVTAPGAGSSTAITARATDSSGQTASRSIAVQGEAPPPPSTTPPPSTPQQPAQAEDGPPTVSITDPTEGAAIDPRFAPKITAQASDDRGVARVGFLDDGKVVCTDDTAPYECQYAPSGGDVGRNTLIAIAVDGAGQTAVDFRAVRVGRFTPALTAATTPRRDRRRPYRYATTGKLALPAGVTAEEACANGGSVDVVMTAGKLKLPLTGALKPDCTYRTSIAFPSRRSLGRGRLTVTTRFAGNEVLGPARAKTQRVRAG